ncbi:MAG: LuxR C-terminal-related transcriptional regulator [Acidobacteriota bacterium]
MSAPGTEGPIRIGLIATEPIRVAGLATVFDQPAEPGKPQLLPVIGSLEELLGSQGPQYLVIDLHSSLGFEAVEAIHRTRPEIRLIVIGPEGDDELVIQSVIAGARAYLDLTAGPEMVRQAIEIVTSGSIWAPRRLLSKLIDRLLNVPEAKPMAGPQLTVREKQVLELIMTARSNREIAEELGIEERTVKAYVARLMRKTGADNRIKLSRSAMSLCLLPQQEEENS